MNTSLPSLAGIQPFMVANGMIYSVVQLLIFLFCAVFILPELGPPDATVAQRFDAYARNGDLLRLGNYLMILPPLFFYLFLGGAYSYFDGRLDSAKSLLFTALLSGAILIIIWPFGMVISLLGVNIAGQGGDHITGAALDAIPPYSLALSTIPRSVFLLCFSLLLSNHKGLSRAGFVIAGLSLLGSLTLVRGYFLPFSLGSALCFHFWMFFCSRTMFRETKSAR
ncbi:hypothetical protein [Larkinella soli]|uniref:hypothetical protein n=1 Tax=Larkinella soli TaxID=1770527 RepID=UPI000FFC3C52|nr:hypothetical protein [Larkinella soli]